MRARGKSVSGNMGQSSILASRATARNLFNKTDGFVNTCTGAEIGGNIPGIGGDFVHENKAAFSWTLPLFDIFQKVPRLTVQQDAKPLYVLPGQPLALPQLLKRGLT